MIHYHLGSQDLSRVRFAFSPLQECVQSYHARSSRSVMVAFSVYVRRCRAATKA